MTTTEQLAAELAGKIPAGWAKAFNAVDRATFIPPRIWIYDDHDEPQPLDRDTDPPGAPFDRIIATASVRPGELPYAWVHQTRPGGIIVTPWGPDYHNGVMARLVVDENGTASGQLSSNLAFMRLRAQQDTVCPLDDGEIGDAQHTTTSLRVYEVVGEFSGALTVGLLVPHCHKILEEDPDDEYHHFVRIHDGATGSWATFDVHRTSNHPLGPSTRPTTAVERDRAGPCLVGPAWPTDLYPARRDSGQNRAIDLARSPRPTRGHVNDSA